MANDGAVLRRTREIMEILRENVFAYVNACPLSVHWTIFLKFFSITYTRVQVPLTFSNKDEINSHSAFQLFYYNRGKKIIIVSVVYL